MDDNCDAPVEEECSVCRATEEELQGFLTEKGIKSEVYDACREPHNWLRWEHGFDAWLKERRAHGEG